MGLPAHDERRGIDHDRRLADITYGAGRKEPLPEPTIQHSPSRSDLFSAHGNSICITGSPPDAQNAGYSE